MVGELDDILTKLDIKNIEEYLIDVVEESNTEGEMKIKMDNLSSLILFAQQMKEGEMHAATGNS